MEYKACSHLAPAADSSPEHSAPVAKAAYADAAGESRAMAAAIEAVAPAVTEWPCKPVVVCGLGPTGAVLALLLAKHRIPVVLLEKERELKNEPRAVSFHPPALDMMAALGIVEPCLEKGLVIDGVRFRDRQSGQYLEFSMSLLAEDSQHPYRLHLEASEMVRVAYEKLREEHADLVQIRLGTRVNWLQEHEGGVTLLVEGPCAMEELEASFVVGADGASSTIRKLLGIPFEGFTYEERFLNVITDLAFDEFIPGLGPVNFVSDPEEWCTVLRSDKNWRALFAIKPEELQSGKSVDAMVQERLHRLCGKQGQYNIIHRALYAVHQRVASRFFKGRCLLAGDACHTHNPLGGFGMNSGIHDAWCAGLKLVRALTEGADYQQEFEDYDRNRRQVAQAWVQQRTKDNKMGMECQDPAAREVRWRALSAKASDPLLAKEFMREHVMLPVLCAGFGVERCSELLEMAASAQSDQVKTDVPEMSRAD